jgi:hypothetical protein
LEKGFIKLSNAFFASPILLVRKPQRGLRFCVDFRDLNAITKKNSYAIPRIDETMGLLGKAKIFLKLDIRQAYHRIRLATAQDSEYTTFSTMYRNYRYLVLLFSLTSAPATFQRFMNEKFMKVLGKSVVLYLDDILVFSDSREEHE